MGGPSHAAKHAAPVVASGLKSVSTTIPNYFTAAWQRYLCSPHQRGYKSSARVLCRGITPADFALMFNQPRRFQQMLPWITLVQGDISAEAEYQRRAELAQKGAASFVARVNLGSSEVYTEGYKCSVNLEAPGNNTHRVGLKFTQPDLYGGIDQLDLDFQFVPYSSVDQDEFHNAVVKSSEATKNFTILNKYLNLPAVGSGAANTQGDTVLQLESKFTFHKQLKYVHPDHVQNLFRTWTEMTLEGLMLDSRDLVNASVKESSATDRTSHFTVVDYKEECDTVDYDKLPLHETHTFNYKPPSWCTW